MRPIERGDGTPFLDTVEAIALALNCTPEELFASPSPDGPAVESLVLAARRMVPKELAWLKEAVSLMIKRPGR
ncbi:hypothetical protein [Phenylobacterium sp.]|uniref:hypothetical protein n=1 Tax=Phenylobacterium sp. TaxID=1871053 RepID=UPI003521B74D